MDMEKRFDLLIRIGSPIITLATVLIGIWQFNQGQKELKEREIEQRNFEMAKINNQATADVLLKFKELQTKQYIEATSVISYLTVNENFGSQEHKNKLERFWQLYWVELSAIESKEVEAEMVHFGNILKDIERNDFKNFKDLQQELKIASYKIAQAIKLSSNTWELPATFKK